MIDLTNTRESDLLNEIAAALPMMKRGENLVYERAHGVKANRGRLRQVFDFKDRFKYTLVSRPTRPVDRTKTMHIEGYGTASADERIWEYMLQKL